MATRALDSVTTRRVREPARVEAKADAKAETRARRYDPAETRNRVLSAAHMLFSTKGFASTGTADIAREADVSEGSIFYHFGSKKALLAELGVRYGHTMIEAMVGTDRLEDLEPGIIIPRVFAFCRANNLWQGVGATCEGVGPKAALQFNPEAEPFFHAAKATTVEWIMKQMTVALPHRGITGVDIELAASFTHHVVGDAIDRILFAEHDPDTQLRVERETVRFVRAACGYPNN